MLSLLKVEFDYESTNEEELTVKEDQLVWVLEDDDEEWFKVKLKSTLPEAQIGLVPASYLTTPTALGQVQALYSYVPVRNEEGELENEEELEVAEGEELTLWEDEGDWVLVSRTNGKGAGFVPSSYVETAGGEVAADPEEIYQEPEPEPVAAPVPYVDPSERVAATKLVPKVAKVSEVKTWSVSEVDKKKKKKKGTLGVGNGAVFFASESDKTPVQQYSLSTLSDVTTEKSKHLHLSFPAGDLHFVISSKDAFDEIVAKIEEDRALANEPTPRPPSGPRTISFPALPSSNSSTPTSTSRAIPPPLSDRPYIPPPPPVRTASYSTPPTPTSAAKGLNGNSVALYDFNPQGEDELSIVEGDRLVFIVGGSDDPDWVKVRKVGSQEEGVVPASYVERDEESRPPTNGHRQEDSEDEEAREEEERLAASDALTLKAQLQADARASRIAAERSEQKRRDSESNARRSRLSVAPVAAPIPLPTRVDVERDARDTSGRRDNGKSREAPKKPASHRVRTWKDRTGQFKVEAEFLGLNGNKIRLHKLNGVIIEVPMEKMSAEDTAYLKRVTSRSSTADDDVPLAQIANQEDRRNERHKRGEAAAASAGPRRTSKASAPSQPTSKKEMDWFDFFLNAGCDMHDCTRYGNNFDKERIEESLIIDIDGSTLRTLGLREGDIIRVLKYIKLKYEPPPTPEKSDRDAKLAIDASMSRAMAPTGPTAPPPNIFTGPDGGLKTTRRGRPNRANSNVNAVDPSTLASAGSELARRGGTTSPANGISSRVASPPIATLSLLEQTPKAPTSQSGGFDDDAWTVKGTAAPIPPPVVVPTPIPEAPPAPPVATSLQTPQRSGSAGPVSTLSYNDGLLAQLGIGARPPSAPVGQTPQYQQQPQPPQLQHQPSYNGPRAPIAPIPVNQGLLAPLIPTVTGMPFRSPYGQQMMMPQATGFVQQQQPMMPNMTGYPQQMGGGMSMGISGMQQPMQQQFTGMPNRNVSPFANPQSPFLQSQPTGMPNFLQPQATGYQQPYQQPQQFNSTPVPSRLVEFNPLPPQQSSAPPASSTSAQFTPSNVFASMKGGQDANKYDALRPQAQGGFQPQMLQPQQTGFGVPLPQQQQPIFPQQTGMYGQNNMNGGYQQQRQY